MTHDRLKIIDHQSSIIDQMAVGNWSRLGSGAAQSMSVTLPQPRRAAADRCRQALVLAEFVAHEQLRQEGHRPVQQSTDRRAPLDDYLMILVITCRLLVIT